MILTVYRIEREFHEKTMRLSPQIPETRASFENDVQPRICVCPSIYGCILAAEIDWQTEKTQKFFLYKAIIDTNKVDVYQPTEKDVPDVFCYRRILVAGRNRVCSARSIRKSSTKRGEREIYAMQFYAHCSACYRTYCRRSMGTGRIWNRRQFFFHFSWKISRIRK